jgi:Protein of unknown function (DUF2442)
MYLSIVEVRPQPDYKLLLTFENGEKKIFEMEKYLDWGVFQELKNIQIFESVHIAMDSIEWSNGIDIDPEELYIDSLPIQEYVQ